MVTVMPFFRYSWNTSNSILSQHNLKGIHHGFERCHNVYKRLIHITNQNYFKQTPEEIDELPEFVYAGKHQKSGTRLYTWGVTLHGAVGRASFLRPDPKRRQQILQFVWKPNRLGFGEIYKVTDVACGYGFTVLSVKNDENSYSCFGTGIATDGQIGLHEPYKGRPLGKLLEPGAIKVPLQPNVVISKVAAGRAHTLMVTNTNEVYSVGNNAYGQCGRPIIEDEDYGRNVVYHHINELEGHEIAQIECGQDTSFILTTKGEIYSCGLSADGQTGRGFTNNQYEMKCVKGDVEGENIVKISCRADCVLALNDKGQVFGWGNSEYRQLNAVTDDQQVTTPIHLPLPSHLGQIKDIAASGSSCFVISESGELYSWGYGHLGRGPDNLHSTAPALIPLTLFGSNILEPDTKVESVTCGINNVAAINSKKSLFMWGKNPGGCLGLGYLDTQYFPLRVSIMGKVHKVSCGIDHTAAIVTSLM